MIGVKKDFYTECLTRGEQVRELLEPLLELTPCERQVFLEYHYFDTGITDVATTLKLSIGEVQEILDKAENKIAITRERPCKEIKAPDNISTTLKHLREITSLVRACKRNEKHN